MNTAPAEMEMENPWKKKELRSKASPKYLILAALMCLVSAVGIPLCGQAWFGPLAVVLALCFYVVFAARSPFSILIILLTAFSMMMIGVGIPGASVVLSLIVGGMTLAYLLTLVKHFYLVFLIPAIGFGISYAVSGDWRLSLLSLAFVPAGILLAIATVGAKPRTTAICFTAAGFLLSLLTLIAVWVYLQTGGLGRGHFLAVIEGIKNAVMQQIEPIREEIFALAKESQNPAAMQLAETFAAMYSEETIVQMMRLVPAVAVVACSILAFNAQLLLGMNYFTTGLGELVPKQARIFTMSLTAAVLYCASFLLLVFMPTGSLAAAVTQNVSLILMPGLALLGIRGLAVSFSKARGGMRVFLILFVGAMLCCSSELIFYILGLWGAYGRISEAIQRKIFEKMIQNGNDHFDGEG